MADPTRFLKLGPKGELQLPDEALQALELKPGESVKLRIDARHKVLHLERHVDDPWSEALKGKKGRELEDLLTEQKQRDAEATRLFEQRLKDPVKPPRPEDRPDHWR
ncbi:MAG: hypothetical protein ACT4PV_00070 [Planctomycetaceae bacterium]